MKAIKIFLLVVVSLIVILLIVTALLPSHYHVEKSLEIEAPASMVYDQVNQLHNWPKWSPWFALDSNMKVTYSDMAEGKDAFFEWNSEKENVGKGKMTIEEAKPSEYLKFDVRFGNGDMKSTSEWKFDEKNGITKVTWTMDGDVGFFGRWFLNSIESQIGADYDNGLAKLDSLVKTLPKYTIDITEMDVQPIRMIAVHDSTSMSESDIQKKMASAFMELLGFMQKNNIPHKGFPIAITNDWGKDFWEFNCGMPIEMDAKYKLSGRIIFDTIPACKVVMGVHVGPYDQSEESFRQIMTYMKEKGYQQDGRIWEEYINDPMNTPPEKLITRIYFPVKEKKTGITIVH